MSDHGIYLDNAAATPVDKHVLQAMIPYFSETFFNPSANYLVAKDVKATILKARQNIATIIGSKETEVIFTAGGTEANNLAIRGILDNHIGCNIVTSNIEHDSVLEPAKLYNHTQVPVHADGRLNLETLQESINKKTVLVSVMYANNEIGTLQPMQEIAKIIQSERKQRIKNGNETPIYFHTDAAQGANYLPILVDSLGVDLMTINGGKIYGPKQSGFLFVKTGVGLVPQIVGGGQEKGARSGTENVPAIIGLSKALSTADDMREKESQRLTTLQNNFIDRLKELFPGATINGSYKYRLPNNVHITLPGIDNERVMMELDERGIMCAVGSACSASNDEPSHVLSAIGLSGEQAQSSLRFSMGRSTTKQDIETTIEQLQRICL